jgi:hypothetical protein
MFCSLPAITLMPVRLIQLTHCHQRTGHSQQGRGHPRSTSENHLNGLDGRKNDWLPRETVALPSDSTLRQFYTSLFKRSSTFLSVSSFLCLTHYDYV